MGSNIYISVVSHGHGGLIKKIGCLEKLSKKFNVIVKNNKPDEELSIFCSSNNCHIIDSNYGCGFGTNNNIAFEYCNEKLKMKDDDIFIVLNPDVKIDSENVSKLAALMNESNCLISAINLFKDEDFTLFDNSIRRFPKLKTFIRSFFLGKNDSVYCKDEINKPTSIDWSSGAFIALRVSHYKKLNGFDEGYFMYCEDVDLCYRSKMHGEHVMYFPQIKAVHYAAHNNRKLFSKHFYWHIKSVFRFLMKSKAYKL